MPLDEPVTTAILPLSSLASEVGAVSFDPDIGALEREEVQEASLVVKS